jgi:sulfide dehydrogenase cytochrome subunit
MTGKKTRYTLLIAMGLMLNPTTWATTSNLSLLVGNCEGCHGPQGSSLGPATPTIAGMAEDTFLDAMEEYQQDERPSTIMGRIAKGYTEEDFKQMATYFRKQPFVRYPQEVDASKAQQGQKLHEEYCEKCHEDNGFTDEDGSSILAGQWMPYLQFSLADFQAGHRKMSKKMKKRLEKMLQAHGEKSLEDIVHFYSSQTEMKK